MKKVAEHAHLVRAESGAILAIDRMQLLAAKAQKEKRIREKREKELMKEQIKSLQERINTLEEQMKRITNGT